MATGMCGTCGGSTPACACYLVQGAGVHIVGDGSLGNPYTVVADNRWSNANAVRNASFAVWQRGTSVAVGAALAFTADGWKAFRAGSVSGMTVSRQLAVDSVGGGFCARLQRDNANASTAVLFLEQSVPTVDSVRFAGRNATLSFRARKGALFSESASQLQANLFTGTGTDETLSSGFTGSASTATNVTLTTSWQTFSVTVAVPSGTTQIGVDFRWTPVGAAGATDYCEVKDVRIDEGSYALGHVPLPYPQDLHDCMRFYEASDANAAATFSGNVTSTGAYYVQQRFAVPKRAAVTVVPTIGSVASFPSTNPTVTSAGTTGFVAQLAANATGVGLYRFTWTASAEI